MSTSHTSSSSSLSLNTEMVELATDSNLARWGPLLCWGASHLCEPAGDLNHPALPPGLPKSCCRLPAASSSLQGCLRTQRPRLGCPTLGTRGCPGGAGPPRRSTCGGRWGRGLGRAPRAGWGERALLSNAGMQWAECGGAGLIWCPTKPPFFPSRCISYSGCLLLSRVSLILPLSPPFPFRPSSNGKGMSSSLQEGN